VHERRRVPERPCPRPLPADRPGNRAHMQRGKSRS
jgi:hypothetical protein